MRNVPPNKCQSTQFKEYIPVVIYYDSLNSVYCRLGDQASSLTLSYIVNFSCTALELLRGGGGNFFSGGNSVLGGKDTSQN